MKRAIDDATVIYDVDVPYRGLVDTMRAEQLQPGDIVRTWHSEGLDWSSRPEVSA